MSIKKPTVKILDVDINKIDEPLMYRCVKKNTTSDMESGFIIIKTSEKMFDFIREFVGHSTELNYFVFTRNPCLISANVRAWFHLFTKNVKDGGGGQAHASALCRLLTKLAHYYPFFKQLQVEMKVATCTKLQGYFLDIFDFKNLSRGQVYMHLRPTVKFNCSVNVLTELMEHRVFSLDSKMLFDKKTIPFVNPGYKQRTEEWGKFKDFLGIVSRRFYTELKRIQEEATKAKKLVNVSELLYNLPGCTMVEVEMTGNISQWQEFMAYRKDNGSTELKNLTKKLYVQFGIKVENNFV